MSENMWGDTRIQIDDQPEFTSDIVAVESLSAVINQAASEEKLPPYFNPAELTVKDGIFYLNLFVCKVHSSPELLTRIKLWFASLSEHDTVKLSVVSSLSGVPVGSYMGLIGAIARCRASIEIQLDCLVDDELAYFYLATDKIRLGSMGALLIPAYCDQQPHLMSDMWRAAHGLFVELVDHACTRGVLTSEDVDILHNGGDVIVPRERLCELSQ